jgi:probable HAF family extracellular repeat protein
MNVAGDQSFHPFLWDGQSIKDLGTLGGNFGNADWLTEAGAVAGWSTTPGDLASHAFLWRRGTMVDLGVTPGNSCSIAYVINSREQVVGGSDDCSGNNPRAFVWERGSIADLNDLVINGVGAQLTVAVGLNETSEIAAQGVISNGDLHAFLLIPCDENHPGVEGCDYSMVDADEVSHVNSAVVPKRQAIANQHAPGSFGAFNRLMPRSGRSLGFGLRGVGGTQSRQAGTSKPSAFFLPNNELGPQVYSRPACEVDRSGFLDGYCTSFYPQCKTSYADHSCPTGYPAAKRQHTTCGWVDPQFVCGFVQKNRGGATTGFTSQ